MGSSETSLAQSALAMPEENYWIIADPLKATSSPTVAPKQLNSTTRSSALFDDLAAIANTNFSAPGPQSLTKTKAQANRSITEPSLFTEDIDQLSITGKSTQVALNTQNSINHTVASSTNHNRDFLTGIDNSSAFVGNSNHNSLSRSKNTSQIAAQNLPDLVGEITKVTMPKTINPRRKDDKGQIKVSVTNQGTQRVRGSLIVGVYASTDPILDASDQLLDRVDRGNAQIQPGHARRFTLDFTNPAGVAPGAWHLLVDIDSGNTIAESNETNNTANTRVSANGTDAVLDWNATLLNAIVTDRSSPPVASRNMAILHSAIYAAVNTPGQEPVSREAAVAAAGHRVLTNLYPTQTATFDIQLASSLAEVADGQAEDSGVLLGQLAADALLLLRSTDGSSTPIVHTPVGTPGDWLPTPPAYAPALLPHWGNVTPFTMTSGSQFRPLGYPALTSAEYTAEFNQVKAWGDRNSTVRTPDQTEMALFWADGAGTFTPPGHWNLIAQQLAVTNGTTLAQNARLFALLNVAEADAGIAAWDAKYVYDLWRPVTAIQQADLDGNPDTIADPAWASLITTPPFPEYVSGHSTFSGAASVVLTAFFGDNVSFETTSIGAPGVVRSYTSFAQAADEAGMSRIYGGIHFWSGNEDGLAMGRALGNHVVSNFFPK